MIRTTEEKVPKNKAIRKVITYCDQCRAYGTAYYNLADYRREFESGSREIPPSQARAHKDTLAECKADCTC